MINRNIFQKKINCAAFQTKQNFQNIIKPQKVIKDWGHNLETLQVCCRLLLAPSSEVNVIIDVIKECILGK